MGPKVFALVLGIALFIGGSTGSGGAATNEEPELVKLARRQFERPLTEAEETLFTKVERGEVADYSAPSEEENDPATAAGWSEKRVLKAECIAWLCTDAEASELVSRQGLMVKGARIEGALELQFANISFPLLFDKAAFRGPIIMLHSRILSLFLHGTRAGSIAAQWMRAEGNVWLAAGFASEGEVNLVGATIGGDLICAGAHLLNKGARVLDCSRLTVGRDLLLSGGFRAEGEVRMLGATIGGDLGCDGGMLLNKGAIALSADGLSVQGSIFMRQGFRSEGEVRLLGAKVGRDVDCDGGHLINPGAYALNADRLRVGGSVFLRRGFRAEGEVRLLCATIGGELDSGAGEFLNAEGYALSADGIDVGREVALDDGRAEGQVSLFGAKVGGPLNCRGAHLLNQRRCALDASHAEVKGCVLFTDGFTAEGEVRLVGATIGGDLDCEKALFVNEGGKALDAEGLEAGGNVFLHKGFRAEGEVRLVSARVHHQLNCVNGVFVNRSAGGYALMADRAKVEESFLMSTEEGTEGYDPVAGGFRAYGEVRLVGATIGGELDCSGARFSNPDPGAWALMADAAKITDHLFVRGGAKIDGRVSLAGATIGGFLRWTGLGASANVVLDLRSASIGTLLDDWGSWPKEGRLFLQGLVYDHLGDGAPNSAQRRMDWLGRQPKGPFSPQPYEQLAAVLRKEGHEEDAKRVLIAKQADRARLTDMPLAKRYAHWLLGVVIGYGYRPWRAVWFILSFVAIGCFLFGTGFRKGLITPTEKSAYVSEGGAERRLSNDYPKFNSLVYSLDAFVPVVGLHMAGYWMPNANEGREVLKLKWVGVRCGGLLRLYLWVHIIAGWTLTTLFVVGLTGLIRT